MRKSQKLRAQTVQKEQYRLTKVENLLTKLLTKVNESINELKVEEFHLKSSLIEQYTSNPHDDQPSTSAQAALRLNKTFLTPDNEDNLKIIESNGSVDTDVNINKQMLALESLLVPLQQNIYKQFEEEDDDDDDMDYLLTENDESEYE